MVYRAVPATASEQEIVRNQRRKVLTFVGGFLPDLRPALTRYGPAELADLFEAFDVTGTYDKPSRSLSSPPPSARTSCRRKTATASSAVAEL